MKHLFAKGLSALLIAALLLAPSALMEELPVQAEDAIIEEAAAEIWEASDDGNESEQGDQAIVEEIDDAAEEAEAELFEAEDIADESAPLYAAASGNLTSNDFEDAIFWNYLIDNFDTINKDGELSPDEVKDVTQMQLYDLADNGDDPDYDKPLQVKSLKGIEFFQNLESLNCKKNQVETLDVSQNKALTSLTITDCNLKTLDVSQNKALTSLLVNGCKLTSLDVSGNPNLEELSCSNNALTSLNVSGCSKLYWLDCGSNKLTSLDISDCSLILAHLDDQYKTVKNDSILYEWEQGADWMTLSIDTTVELITSNQTAQPATDPGTVAAPAQTVASAPAVTAPATAALTIAATKKSSKATITAAPGTVYQLDLAGVIGKSFKSSNKKVATVDQNGNVTFKKAGKVKITFKVGRKKRTVILTVKDPTIPKSVTLNMTGTNAVKKGDVVTLTATIPAGTISGIKWKSSNKKVATVNNGVVTFKKAGKVTITATATRGKKKAKVKFKVSK